MSFERYILPFIVGVGRLARGIRPSRRGRLIGPSVDPVPVCDSVITNECFTESQDFQDGADIDSQPSVVYCSGLSGTPQDPCALTGNTDSSEVTRCTGRTSPRIRNVARKRSHDFCIEFEGQSRLWDGSDVPFHFIEGLDADETKGFHGDRHRVWVTPCSTSLAPDEHWLCRWTFLNADFPGSLGWSIECHDVLQGSTAGTDQLGTNPVELFLPTDGRMMFVEFGTFPTVNCFQGFAGRFCFSQVCDDNLVDLDQHRWDCVGREGVDDGTALRGEQQIPDDLLASHRTPEIDARYNAENTTHPRNNIFAVKLLNAAWRVPNSFDSLRIGFHLRMDEGFESRSNHDDFDKTTWSQTWTSFGQGGAIVDPIVRGFRLLDSLEAYDYRELDGLPIWITLRGLVTAVEIPALLHVQSLTIRTTHDTEKSTVGGGNPIRYRTTGDANLQLQLRVRRVLPGDPRPFPGRVQPGRGPRPVPPRGHPFGWLNEQDPFDLRIADPDRPGREHPYERMIARGPHGERVPHQERETPETGAFIHWEALKCTTQWSFGPNSFDELAGRADDGICCGVMHSLDETVFMGRTNDNPPLRNGPANPLSQRYEGSVRFGIDNLRHHTFCGY